MPYAIERFDNTPVMRIFLPCKNAMRNSSWSVRVAPSKRAIVGAMSPFENLASIEN